MTDEYAKHRFRLRDLVIRAPVLGVAVLIALPFIQTAATYAQDCIRCSGNLRLLALACHNINDVQGMLPPFKSPGGADLKSYFGTPANHGSVFFFMTPWLEQGDVFESAALVNASGLTAHDVDVTEGMGRLSRSPAPPFAGQKSLLLLHCPIDPTMPSDGQITADPEGLGASQPWGACSYACNYLLFGNAQAVERNELDNPDRYDPAANPPHIAPSTCPRIPQSFPDGTSNTYLFTETLANCQWTQAGSAPPVEGGNLWGPAVDNARWAARLRHGVPLAQRHNLSTAAIACRMQCGLSIKRTLRFLAGRHGGRNGSPDFASNVQHSLLLLLRTKRTGVLAPRWSLTPKAAELGNCDPPRASALMCLGKVPAFGAQHV